MVIFKRRGFPVKAPPFDVAYASTTGYYQHEGLLRFGR